MSRPNWVPLRFFDEVVGASQFAAQFFGFLPDGRKAVEMTKEGQVLRVAFSDRTLEGWPPVEVTIPARFEFRQATSSVLTRSADFSAPGSLDDARTWFRDAGLSVPPDSKCIDLGRGARLKISTVRDHVAVVLQQRRDDEDLKDAIMDRVGGFGQT